MVSISNNDIKITRGDTLETTISIMTRGGGAYVPSEGDAIRFAVKKKYADIQPLIVKEIPINTMVLRLESTETKKLATGKEPYVYDVEITMANGTVDTFISGNIYIIEEVY